MERFIVAAVFRMRMLDVEQAHKLGCAVMDVIGEHLSLDDPHAATDMQNQQLEVEFGFFSVHGDEAELDARSYAGQVVAHACIRAGVDVLSVKFVSQQVRRA